MERCLCPEVPDQSSIFRVTRKDFSVLGKFCPDATNSWCRLSQTISNKKYLEILFFLYSNNSRCFLILRRRHCRRRAKQKEQYLGSISLEAQGQTNMQRSSFRHRSGLNEYTLSCLSINTHTHTRRKPPNIYCDLLSHHPHLHHAEPPTLFFSPGPVLPPPRLPNPPLLFLSTHHLLYTSFSSSRHESKWVV